MTMADSPTPAPASLKENTNAAKKQHIWLLRYLISLILGGGLVWSLLHEAPWLLQNPNKQDIAIIRGQTADLTHRVDQLEEAVKHPTLPTVDPTKIKSMEAVLTGMHQKIENLQEAIAKQAEGASPQPLRKDLTEPLEKDLCQLAKAQQILKSVILFWHLKEKILSDAPYMSELITYKAHTSVNGDLSSLEEHAVRGLGVYKKSIKQEALEPTQTTSSSSQDQISIFSWWQRLQTSAKSLVSIEKIETPYALPTPANHDEQNRKNVKTTLARLEQTLIHQLTAIPFPNLAASLGRDES